jgi:hypothetical protein
MTENQFEQRLEDLESRLDVLAEQAVDHVAWHISQRTIASVLVRHLLRQSLDPVRALAALRDYAEDTLEHRTFLPGANENSKRLYLEKAAQHLRQFFDGIKIGEPEGT